MIVALVLITGVLAIVVLGAIGLIWMHMGNVLPSLVPLAPGVVMLGSFLLILTELILFFGNKDDRKSALRDLTYLLPVCLVSAGLWYGLKLFLW